MFNYIANIKSRVWVSWFTNSGRFVLECEVCFRKEGDPHLRWEAGFHLFLNHTKILPRRQEESRSPLQWHSKNPFISRGVMCAEIRGSSVIIMIWLNNLSTKCRSHSLWLHRRINLSTVDTFVVSEQTQERERENQAKQREQLSKRSSESWELPDQKRASKGRSLSVLYAFLDSS